MNEELKNFAVTTLKRDLNLLPETWQRKFKLMYGRRNGTRSIEDTEKMDINSVVDEVPDENLDWAMQQVARSIAKARASRKNGA